MNIDRMCRVCEAINGLKDIFDEDNEELLHMLRRVADISIETNDLLPKQICNTCAYRLQIAYKFKMLCELTDKAFRTRLETGSLSIKAPKISPQDTDCADVAVESIEQCKVESNLDLDSTTVKEEYLFKDELEESSNIIESIDPQIQNCSETRLKDDCDSSGCGGTGLDDNRLLDVVDEEKLDETSNIENSLDGERRLIDSGEQNIKVNKKVKRRKIDKTYTCPVCSASCTGFAQFKVHKKTHGKYCYQCAICDKKFAAITTRKLHVESVHTDMKVSCELCSKQFSNSATLHTHIRRYHENRTKQHVCTVCNKSFLTKSNWKAHMETHGTERKYACDECPTTFKTASGLNAHKQTHKPREESTRHRSRLFICEHCGKQSSSQPTHLNHLKTHMDAKPFVCSVCQKCFRAKITLDQHMLLHTGEKPFSCNLCGMSFRQAAHLRTHLRSIHEQARPHICQWCERAFTSASNLKAHTRIHTGETPFECNFCPLRFTTSKNLKRHRLKEHANDISDIKVVPSATNDDDDSSVAEIIEVEMDKSS